MMKIALGTVQWGLNYGISNKKGIPSKDELNRILSFADKSGINLLDTASAYGNSEARIGDFSKNKFNLHAFFKSQLTATIFLLLSPASTNDSPKESLILLIMLN